MANKRITQATFDEVVQENIEEFEMTPEDALQEAIQQFESQGVDLVNILKTIPVGDGKQQSTRHPILEALDQLNIILRGEITDVDTIRASFATFSAECAKDISHRVAAGTNNAYPTVGYLIKKYRTDPRVLPAALDAMSSLLNGQPDLLESDGIKMLCSLLEEEAQTPQAILAPCLRTVRLSCTLHEMNRRAFATAGLPPLLVRTLKTNVSSASIVKECCGAVRVMTLDDDIRVPFGKAHDHSKMIVEAGALKAFVDALKVHVCEPVLASELCACLSSLAVRNEFCQEIVDLGGLDLVLDVLDKNRHQRAVVKQVLATLKAVAGNDAVKIAIMNAEGALVITQAVSQHIKHHRVCETGFAAVAAVTLRNPTHSKLFMESGVAAVIIQAMQLHPKEPAVQTKACMALRNLVARCREHCSTILSLGAETLIRNARVHCQDEAKAALRDLGCDVDLKESWKGEKLPMMMT